MAKQTFTTGQVLTAAQMTSLQQTAMLGGAASAKTASYTLVAADAGTAISMSNASATTITVNTALFAAGDTVHITNLGAGVCTITAGTATVNSSASLALAQYESGFLDFTSTSAAIFVKGAGAAAGGGANWSLLNAGGTATTGASTITVSGISGASQIFVLCSYVGSASASSELSFRFNADSGSNYIMSGVLEGTASNDLLHTGSTTRIYFGKCGTAAGTTQTPAMLVSGASTSGVKVFDCVSMGNGTDAQGRSMKGVYSGSSAITSVSIISSIGNFDEGTIYVYTTA
jgi:hypothetical protein